MAQDPNLAKGNADPQQCWKDITKHKNNPINYYILSLDGKKITVSSSGTGKSIDQVISEASAGKLIYLRVDGHEEGAYDDAVIKV